MRDKLSALGKAEDDGLDDLDWVEVIDLSGLAAVGEVMTDPLTETAQASAKQILARIGVDDRADLVDQVNDAAAEWAQDRAAELVSQITESTRTRLRDIIANGLADGKRSGEIADEIQDVDTGLFSEDRAALIANTEVAGANSGGALVGMKEAQDAGVGMLKEWGVDSDPCPICEENADAGPIPLDEDFPSGDDAPQAHPGCLCVLVGVVTDEPAAEEDDQADLPDESEE